MNVYVTLILVDFVVNINKYSKTIFYMLKDTPISLTTSSITRETQNFDLKLCNVRI